MRIWFKWIFAKPKNRTSLRLGTCIWINTSLLFFQSFLVLPAQYLLTYHRDACMYWALLSFPTFVCEHQTLLILVIDQFLLSAPSFKCSRAFVYILSFHRKERFSHEGQENIIGESSLTSFWAANSSTMGPRLFFKFIKINLLKFRFMKSLHQTAIWKNSNFCANSARSKT